MTLKITDNQNGRLS